MQPRTLSQIVDSLGSTYDPQVALNQQQLGSLPTQQAADESGLAAQQAASFDDILNAARGRGLGFSGIPIGEQAKYTATSYLPALANLKSTYQQKTFGLQDALNQIYANRNTQAQGIYQNEQSMAEQQREFNADQAFKQQQLAADQQNAAAARAASASSGISPSVIAALLGGGGAAPAAKAAGAATDPTQQDAYNDVASRINAKQSDQQLMSDYLATAASAKNGNQRDLYKLQIYQQLRPDVFKNTYSFQNPTNATANPSSTSQSVNYLRSVLGLS